MASKLALFALLQGVDAAAYSADLIAPLCLSSTTSDGATSAQYCLAANSWTQGQCCDTSAAVPADGLCAVAPQSDGSAYTNGKPFCGTKASLSNKFLVEFLMASNSEKCPTTYELKQISETQTVEVFDFPFTVPDSSASTWHCKYGLTTSTKIPAGTADDAKGYYYLVAENYGFDNNVIIIVQPRGEYLDFNFRSQTNNPAKMTKVFKSFFGRKYVIPAEYDVFIDFAPISYKTAGQESLSEGKFQFLAKWIPNSEVADYENDATVEIVKRLPPLAGTEVTPAPVIDPTDDKDSFEQQDNSVLPAVEDRKSAIDDSNVKGSKWQTWKNEEAFNVGGVSVSKEEAAVGSTAVLIIIIGIVCICCFVSYLERKKIAEEARRASAYAKRASQKIRRSIKSMRGQDPGPEEPEAPKTEKEIKKMASENATNKNEKAFLNDMFTE